MNTTSNQATASPTSTSPLRKSMGAADHRHHLHGLRGQSAVRLDAVRQSDRCQIPLGTRGHPGGIHHLRADRDLARSGRRLSGRPVRSALGGHRRRHPGRDRVGDQFRRRFACRSCTSPPRSAVSAPAVFTAPASAMRSNGSRAGAASLPASPPRASAQARRSPSIPISHMIATDGYEHAFLRLRAHARRHRVRHGVAAPGAAAVDPDRCGQAQSRLRTGTSPPKCCEVRCSTCCIVMFVLIAAGGLSMAASVDADCQGFQDRQDPGRSVRRGAAGAGVCAVSLNRIFDGVGRPFFGWLSDQIGREYTMAIAFLIGAGALFTLSQIGGSNPVVFVLVTAVYFGVYGEIFSLFPATQGDTFGSKYAAANAGMLYTAKGTGALLVPIAAGIAKTYGHGTVFFIFVTFNVVAALLALFVLKPMRAQALREEPVSRIRRSGRSRGTTPDLMGLLPMSCRCEPPSCRSTARNHVWRDNGNRKPRIDSAEEHDRRRHPSAQEPRGGRDLGRPLGGQGAQERGCRHDIHPMRRPHHRHL